MDCTIAETNYRNVEGTRKEMPLNLITGGCGVSKCSGSDLGVYHHRHNQHQKVLIVLFLGGAQYACAGGG